MVIGNFLIVIWRIIGIIEFFGDNIGEYLYDLRFSSDILVIILKA